MKMIPQPSDTSKTLFTADGFEFIAAARKLLLHSELISTPCVLFDLQLLDRQIDQWFSEMRDIKPHFAVKACDATGVLLHLKERGVAFDAATGGELERLSQLGVPGSDIVMTHSRNYLIECRQVALRLGVLGHMTMSMKIEMP